MIPRLFERCPIGCDSGLRLTHITLPEGTLRQCHECGQLLSACSPQQYSQALDKWDTQTGTLPLTGAEIRYSTVARRRLRHIRELLGRKPNFIRLLDVGCSSGAFLEIATAKGFAAEGVEPAVKPAATAQRAGLRVHSGTLSEQNFPDKSYDAITLFEIIEHLPSPRDMIIECRRILRRDGVIAINTPNAASWTARVMGARWEGFDLHKMGGHISFFNPASLRLLAERCGLTVERLETRNVRFFEKGETAPLLYSMAKLGAESLNLPSRWFDMGHDMLAFLRRKN